MNKSILVLDENSVIHGLVTSALEAEGLTLHHEFNPGRYVDRATSLMPDLILLGNSDRDPGYDMARRIKAGQLADVPMVLLASSRESLSREQMQHLRVNGVVRKPFEASDLQQQVSKHLNLVDLIGSAYEYRQSQSTADEGANPLADLDVLDDEVLGLLRGTAPLGGGAVAEAPAMPGAPVVDDEVLAETLQPERAFERLDAAAGERATRFDSLETLEGEFPSQALELPGSEDELDELGASDVLDEEAPEETVLAPQGFDQELDAEEGGAAGRGAELDEIEVELGEDLAGLQEAAPELEESGVDLFETDLDAMEPREEAAFEESIPLSVRRMMELKPVFTMTQEETAADEAVLEPFDFEPDLDEVEAIQHDLDALGEVDLDDTESQPPPARAAAAAPRGEAGLEPPEDFRLVDEAEPEVAPAAAKAEPAWTAPTMRVEEQPGEALEFDELEGAEIGETLEAEQVEEEEPEPAPAPRGARLAAEPEEGGDEEDFFVDEYLGDEEIDEEQIIAADDGEIEEQPELTAEDEAELDELLAEEEHLGDLDDFDDLDTDDLADAEAAEEEVELEPEEEDLILSSMEEERRGPAMGAEEPLFERNLKSLAEEPAGETEGAAEPQGEREEWKLEQADGGFAFAQGDEAEAGGEVIQLHTPEPEEAPGLDAMEEVPSSALEEIEEAPLEAVPLEAVSLGEASLEAEPLEAVSLEAEPLEAEPLEAMSVDEGLEAETFEAEELEAVSMEPPAEDDEPVSIEFGEGGGDVFDEERDSWRPSRPPSFVSRPAEDFPEDAVREPFTGPEAEPEEAHADSPPRHAPEEVLEDPDSLRPVLDEPGLGAADLADEVRPHELDLDEGEALEPEEDIVATPLSALADHALGAVEKPGAAVAAVDELTLDAELGPDDGSAWEEEPAMGDAFEPVELGAEAPASSAAVSQGEMEALIGEEPGIAAQDEDLDSLLGGGEAAAPAAAATAGGDSDFDDLFSSLREEIAANPEGERLDDVLRKERIRDQAAALEFALPQHEHSFARALGIYALPGEGAGASAFPAAFGGAGAAAAAARPAAAAAPAAAPAAPSAPPAAAARGVSAADVSALSLLDPDIRAKLGQVLDEIISISVRKAVQEEMPKIMERMSRNP